MMACSSEAISWRVRRHRPGRVKRPWPRGESPRTHRRAVRAAGSGADEPAHKAGRSVHRGPEDRDADRPGRRGGSRRGSPGCSRAARCLLSLSKGSSLSAKAPKRSLGRSKALWMRHTPLPRLAGAPALGTAVASRIRISRPRLAGGARRRHPGRRRGRLWPISTPNHSPHWRSRRSSATFDRSAGPLAAAQAAVSRKPCWPRQYASTSRNSSTAFLTPRGRTKALLARALAASAAGPPSRSTKPCQSSFNSRS
jgi:hypothetical protein